MIKKLLLMLCIAATVLSSCDFMDTEELEEPGTSDEPATQTTDDSTDDDSSTSDEDSTDVDSNYDNSAYETDFTLTSGQSGRGTLSDGGSDSWTFTANVGDFIAVSAGDGSESSDFTPYISLTSPSGVLLDDDINSYYGSYIWITATETGTYTLLVKDYYSKKDSLSYEISLVVSGTSQTISTGDEGGSLVNGTTVSGFLAYGDTDGWRFYADEGDYIAVSVGDGGSESDITPYIALISPSGEWLDSDSGGYGASIEENATEDGFYTLIIRAYRQDAKGDYEISLVISGELLTISAGNHGGSLINGTTVSGVLHYGDMDGWTFSVDEGDYIAVSAGDGASESDITPYIALISPSGERLGYSNYGSCIRKRSTEDGLYTVIIRDSSDNDIGLYEVSLVVSGETLTISADDQGGTISYGESESGTINYGEIDGWTFSGSTDDNIIIAMEDVSTEAELTPFLVLIAPSGELIGSSAASSTSTITGFSETLEETGIFTIISMDDGNDDIGEYVLTLELDTD